QASKTLLAIQLKNRGDEISESEKAALLHEIKERYWAAAQPRYAAARQWFDEIIDPRETRAIISRSIQAAAHQARIEDFKVGVLQT
ncbi:MAG: acyl-CoA carboxylase subunit beta, partial [Acidobacteria bacterium]